MSTLWVIPCAGCGLQIMSSVKPADGEMFFHAACTADSGQSRIQVDMQRIVREEIERAIPGIIKQLSGAVAQVIQDLQ